MSTDWKSLRAILPLALALLAAPALAQVAGRADGDQIMPDGASLAVSKGVALRSVEWRQHEIPVCWINPAPDDAAQRAVVRDAVRQTWEAAANLRLVGWQSCDDPGNPGRMVRIQVGDGEWPRAIVGVGALSRRLPTMFLNFNLARSPGFAGCVGREERCLRFTAVHEFGHMLGLIHEQDRPETPADCIAGLAPGQRQTRNTADLDLLTGYDPDSLMNYCSTRGYDARVPLVLSDEDGVAIRKLFGPPLPATGAQAAVTEPGVGAKPAAPATPRPAGANGAAAADQGQRRQERPLFDPS